MEAVIYDSVLSIQSLDSFNKCGKLAVVNLNISVTIVIECTVAELKQLII